MPQCIIHNHLHGDRFISFLKPSDMDDCIKALTEENHAILKTCVDNGWLESISSWGQLGTDEYAKIISCAFEFRDSLPPDSDEYDVIISVIITIAGILCAKIHGTLGMNVDTVHIINSTECKVSISVTASEMYHFRLASEDENDPKVLKVAFDKK